MGSSVSKQTAGKIAGGVVGAAAAIVVIVLSVVMAVQKKHKPQPFVPDSAGSGSVNPSVAFVPFGVTTGTPSANGPVFTLQQYSSTSLPQGFVGQAPIAATASGGPIAFKVDLYPVVDGIVDNSNVHVGLMAATGTTPATVVYGLNFYGLNVGEWINGNPGPNGAPNPRSSVAHFTYNNGVLSYRVADDSNKTTLQGTIAVDTTASPSYVFGAVSSYVQNTFTVAVLEDAAFSGSA